MQDAGPSHAATLAELTTLAMDVARTLHARITAPGTEAQALPDLAAAFDRAARCVRRCVLLADHLARPPAPLKAAPDRTAARRTAIRAVEDHILGADPRPENPDALRRELLERIEAPEFERDLATTPLAAIIETLARDLNVAPFQGIVRWPRRTPADIARLEHQAQGTHDPAHPPWTHTPRRPFPPGKGLGEASAPPAPPLDQLTRLARQRP